MKYPPFYGGIFIYIRWAVLSGGLLRRPLIKCPGGTFLGRVIIGIQSLVSWGQAGKNCIYIKIVKPQESIGAIPAVLLFIELWIVGSVKQIVYTDIIKV